MFSECIHSAAGGPGYGQSIVTHDPGPQTSTWDIFDLFYLGCGRPHIFGLLFELSINFGKTLSTALLPSRLLTLDFRQHSSSFIFRHATMQTDPCEVRMYSLAPKSN